MGRRSLAEISGDEGDDYNCDYDDYIGEHQQKCYCPLTSPGSQADADTDTQIHGHSDTQQIRRL